MKRLIMLFMIVVTTLCTTGCVVVVNEQRIEELKQEAKDNAKKWVEEQKNKAIRLVYRDEGYVIQYDGSGDDVENLPEEQEVKKGFHLGKEKISETRPTRVGYHFLGWTDEQGSSEI